MSDNQPQVGTCPDCGTDIKRLPGEHWVLLDGGKRVCTNPWHSPLRQGSVGGQFPSQCCPARAGSSLILPVLEIYQHDWSPGWASFLEDGSIAEGAKAHATLNLGSCLVAVESGELPAKDLPYLIAESIMHEAIHALESWAKVEFSEERVEELLEVYRKKYRPDDEMHWHNDPTLERDNSNQFASPPSSPGAAQTRFNDFDDDAHPFRKWWQEHGQFMLSGGSRRESIWAARGWIAREQMACGAEVTGDSMHERVSSPGADTEQK